MSSAGAALPRPGRRLGLLQLMLTASRRMESTEAYRNFQRTQAELLLQYLRDQEVELASADVLDLGCGYGGYSDVFRSEGASVISSDLIIEPSVAGELSTSGQALQADATSLPVRDESMDFVFCASLIEHVEKPLQLLSEIRRVLRAGGKCYLSFPPFYSPVGGHQFKPFHLLGEGAAISLHRLTHKGDHGASAFANAYGAWGLYPRTIGGVRRDVQALGFSILDQSTRFLPLNVSRVPLLSEFLTWHVQFLLLKPAWSERCA